MVRGPNFLMAFPSPVPAQFHRAFRSQSPSNRRRRLRPPRRRSASGDNTAVDLASQATTSGGSGDGGRRQRRRLQDSGQKSAARGKSKSAKGVQTDALGAISLSSSTSTPGTASSSSAPPSSNPVTPIKKMADSNNPMRGAFPSQNLPYPMYPPPSQLPQSYEQFYNAGQAFRNYAMYPPTTIDLEGSTPHPIPPPCHPAWFSQNYMQPGPVNQPPGKRSRAKKAAASKGGSHRQENFSIEEEKLLCSAYLYVCKDPIVGVNQTGEAYWERIERYFNENNPGRPHRSSGSLKQKWKKIQLAVTKFCGYKAAVDREHSSGMTQQDRIEEAKARFHEFRRKPFKYMHCWEILRNERKWLDDMARKFKDDEVEHMEVSTGCGNTSTEPSETPQTRPMGRDSAKKRRSSDSAYSNASSAFVEVMQQIGTSRDKKMEMYAAYMTARREEREARNAKQEARTAEIAARNEAARQRELAIQEQQQRLMAEQEENKVMLCDPSNFNEVQREWLRVKQQRYLKRLMEEERLRDEAAGAGGSN